MRTAINRRRLIATGAAGAAGAAFPRPALAQGRIEWRMVTSWPKNLPGPGISADRLASRIGALSGGRLTVRLYAAGELVPGFEVFDAVAGGVAEMAHTAAFYWSGKIPAAVFFTTVPFGLTPPEHVAWIEHGGGQELWDRLYRPFGLKPFMAGNTGFQMGGWFARPIRSLDDISGIKIRAAGLGAEVYRALGATAVSMPPGEIMPALQSGLVDAVEFLGPFSDVAMGFQKVAPHYLGPTFNKPNGTGEAIVSIRALEALPGDLQAMVAAACREEAALGLAEADWMNGAALQRLAADPGVTVSTFPDDVLAAARRAADQLFADLSAQSADTAAVLASYAAARRTLGRWSSASIAPFLAARSD